MWCLNSVTGHQKKLMLAVKRLAEMQRGSLRKKPPPITQQQDVMSADGPPLDGERNRLKMTQMFCDDL